MSTRDTTSVLVVGGGLMGTAAARSLAESGREVTLVERDVAASEHGSSHGSARIFRYGYPDPFYARLVTRSRPLFDDLSRRAGRELITPTGALEFGSVRRPELIAAALEAAGVEHELMDAATASARWRGIVFDTDVLWHPDAGVIDAASTVHAQLALARAAGARIREGWEARSIERTAGGYRVTGADGSTIDAGQVVLAVGAWLEDLLARTELPTGFHDALPRARVTQENAYHFPYRDDPAESTGPRAPWPAIIHKTEELQLYALPGGRDADHRGQKVARYLGGRTLADATAQDGRIDPLDRARMVEHVRENLPGLVPEPYAETTCLFTMLPGEDFLVDRAEGLIVASPCSGHGAKFAPLIGQIIAEIADGGSGPERFTAAAFGQRKVAA